jgi:LPS sulfotransferase NodH
MTGPASPPTRFVILATQRTGSTWLTDMLDSHPAISSYEELFLPADEDRRPWGPAHQEFFDDYYRDHVKREWPLSRPYWAVRYLEDLYGPRSATGAVGMKLMYSQLKERPWLLAYMALRRVRVVHLVRTNLLDVILSGETARARRQYHALASDAVAPSTVSLPVEDLVSELERLRRSVDRIRLLLKLLPAPSVEVSYEDLTRDDAAFGPVFDLLGVEPRRLTSRFTKLNREPKAELIANYAEVESALKGTPFESYLASISDPPLSPTQPS